MALDTKTFFFLLRKFCLILELRLAGTAEDYIKPILLRRVSSDPNKMVIISHDYPMRRFRWGGAARGQRARGSTRIEESDVIGTLPRSMGT